MIRRVHFINFVRKFTLTSSLFLAPLYFLKLGFGGAAIGLIVSAFAVAPLVLSFPTGWVNDRLSMKNVVLGGLAAESLSFLLIGAARGPAPMAAAFLLLGLSNNALDVSINSLYYKDGADARPNRKYGTYIFWMSIGPPAGLVAGGLLTQLGGFRLLVAVFAALTLLAALAVRGFGAERFSVVRLADYRSRILNPRTLAFAGLLFILASHWGVEGTVYSPFLRERFGLGDLGVAAYMALAYLGLAFSALAVGRLAFDPARNRRLLLAGMALSGLGLVLMVQDDLRLSFLFRVVHECGDGMMGALVLLTVSRLFEKHLIGGSAGILMSIQTAGQIAGAIVFPSLGYRLGLQVPFFVAGALLLINAGYGVFAVPRERAAEAAVSP